MLESFMINDKPLIQLQSIKYIAGYNYNINQPSLAVVVSINKHNNTLKLLSEVDIIIKQLIPSYNKDDYKEINDINIIKRLLIITNLFSNLTKSPKFSNSEIMLQKKFTTVYIPVMGHDQNIQKNIISWAIDIFSGNYKKIKQHFNPLLKSFKRASPKGLNTYRILKLAHGYNIPWKHLSNNVFQLGWGSKSRLIDSTFTDETSVISAQLARDKLTTKQLLKSVGLPVAQSIIVNSKNEVIKIAKKLGYPLVVKPTNLDGGKGVSAGLLSEKLILKAYEKAKSLSRSIMIEKHFEGNDHRLHIHNGKLYYSTLRIPGGVTGDGKSSIEHLINDLNISRKQKIGIHKQLIKDEELYDLLEVQNLTLESIPEDGKFIKLRSIANVSAGGTSITIENLNTIHKDNVELAKKAVSVLRLDVAAVDLLIPDITKSWMEVGAIITEVNAKPQIGDDARLGYLVKQLVKKEGRIPSIIIVGNADIEFINSVINQVKRKNFNIGVSTNSNIYKNNEITSNISPISLYDGGTALVNDPTIDAMIMYIENENMLSNGLAVDKFDILVLSSFQDNKRYTPNLHKSIINISKMTNQVLVDKDSNIWNGISKNIDKEISFVETVEIENSIKKIFSNSI